MPNDRLRDALMRNGFTTVSIASELMVDPKTVERWITLGRTPYPKHRFKIAALVRETETFLWPDATNPSRSAEIAGSEVVQVYPHRHEIPRDLWLRLLADTAEHLDFLVYAGLFLTDDPSLLDVLRRKADAGARVRILLGDPKGSAVKQRTAEERIGAGAIAAKVRNTMAFFDPVIGIPGIEFRFHNTTLYNSIYRFDDEMLVNTHVYGRMAAHSPTIHLRRLTGGPLFDIYSQSVDTVWEGAKPLPTATAKAG